MTNPTERFSNRVESYVQARPGYPQEVIELLAARCGLTPQAVVADVGSGTGILTRMLLEHGNRVYAVEPNDAMRQVAEAALGGYAGFTSVAGTAEATGLPEHSVDLITAAQAFHWFNPQPTHREFARILRPGGWVALIWNERRSSGTPFMEAYEQLLQRRAIDYGAVSHKRISEADLQRFFGAAPLQKATFSNWQSFDLPGLRARLLSSSYTPAPGQPGHDEMFDALAAIFAQHEVDGQVRMEYDTMVYYGQIPVEAG